MRADPLTMRDVDTLRALRSRFGRAEADEKRRALERLGGRRLASPRVLRDYHAQLLFLVAHPDDADVLALAETELARVAAAAAGWPDELVDRLELTGIANTITRASFSADLLRWLVRRYPKDVEIAYEEGSAGEGLDALLPLLVTRPEIDGLLGEGPSAEEWIAGAKGPGQGSHLRWLLRLLRRLGGAPELLDHTLEAIDLTVAWRLTGTCSSTTWLRFPVRPIVFQRRRPERRVSLRRVLARPLPHCEPLPVEEATRLIDVARATLGARGRETDPVTYANPEEVYLVSLDEGIDVAIFGMQPERRLPIESYFGYVAARNRVPCAYGGGWVFGERLEIGVNVFDELRGGASARIFADVLRVYAQLFRPSYVDVDPYQVGVGNDDGLRSGAFWFYYRLGFRPVCAAERSLASEEWRRIRATRSHRTPIRTLRRLAASPLRLGLRGGASGRRALPELGDLARGVTAIVGERFGGDHTRAAREAWREASSWSLPSTRDAWSSTERRAARRLATLAVALPGVATWSARDRASLLAVLHAKGGARERDFAERLRAHPRLRDALERLAGRDGAPAHAPR